jgi:hypothetical protein
MQNERYINIEIVCPVYQCGELYSAYNLYDSQCPKCGISVNETYEAGTNDRKLILEHRKQGVEK